MPFMLWVRKSMWGSSSYHVRSVCVCVCAHACMCAFVFVFRNWGNDHRVGPWTIWVHSQSDLSYNLMFHLTTLKLKHTDHSGILSSKELRSVQRHCLFIRKRSGHFLLTMLHFLLIMATSLWGKDYSKMYVCTCYSHAESLKGLVFTLFNRFWVSELTQRWQLLRRL